MFQGRRMAPDGVILRLYQLIVKSSESEKLHDESHR